MTLPTRRTALHLFHTSRDAAIYLVFRYTIVNQGEHLHSMPMPFSMLKLLEIELQNAEGTATLGRAALCRSSRRAHDVLDDVIKPRAEAPACDHSCCHLHAHLLAPAIATSMYRETLGCLACLPCMLRLHMYLLHYFLGYRLSAWQSQWSPTVEGAGSHVNAL